MHVTFSPSGELLEQVLKWLETEYGSKAEETVFGNAVISGFRDLNLAIATELGEAVGFATIIKGYDTVTLESFSIRPEDRRKGKGKLFILDLADTLTREGFYAVDLIAKSSEAFKFWGGLGFEKGLDIEEEKLFLPLKSKSEFCDHEFCGDLLEIYPDSCISKNDRPVRTIPLLFLTDSSTLQDPIILYANPDWKARWIKNGILIREFSLKHMHANMVNCFIAETFS